MHHVYIGSYANATYVGMTKNLTNRLYTHKARYNQTIDGSDYFCYMVWRNITESFDDIEWKIVKSFKSKEAAKKHEIELIKKIGNLNDQHSDTSQKYKYQMLIESMKHYE